MQGSSSDEKIPTKGILKTSASFYERCAPSGSRRKRAKFDELNVLKTYHPPDKDYGHMKIEEPPTPYNFSDLDLDTSDQLDVDLLAEKLKVVANLTDFSDDKSSEDDENETEAQRGRRKDFEKRRKAHYMEFQAVKLARKLIAEEDAEDNVKSSNKSPGTMESQRSRRPRDAVVNIVKPGGPSTSKFSKR